MVIDASKFLNLTSRTKKGETAMAAQTLRESGAPSVSGGIDVSIFADNTETEFVENISGKSITELTEDEKKQYIALYTLLNTDEDDTISAEEAQRLAEAGEGRLETENDREYWQGLIDSSDINVLMDEVNAIDEEELAQIIEDAIATGEDLGVDVKPAVDTPKIDATEDMQDSQIGDTGYYVDGAVAVTDWGTGDNDCLYHIMSTNYPDVERGSAEWDQLQNVLMDANPHIYDSGRSSLDGTRLNSYIFTGETFNLVTTEVPEEKPVVTTDYDESTGTLTTTEKYTDGSSVVTVTDKQGDVVSKYEQTDVTDEETGERTKTFTTLDPETGEPTGTHSVYKYNADGKLIYTESGNGDELNTTNYTYNEDGTSLQVQQRADGSRSFVYDNDSDEIINISSPTTLVEAGDGTYTINGTNCDYDPVTGQISNVGLTRTGLIDGGRTTTYDYSVGSVNGAFEVTDGKYVFYDKSVEPLETYYDVVYDSATGSITTQDGTVISSGVQNNQTSWTYSNSEYPNATLVSVGDGTYTINGMPCEFDSATGRVTVLAQETTRYELEELGIDDAHGDTFTEYLQIQGVDIETATLEKLGTLADSYNESIAQKNAFLDLYSYFENNPILAQYLTDIYNLTDTDIQSGTVKQTLKELYELVSDLGAFQEASPNNPRQRVNYDKTFEERVASAIEQMQLIINNGNFSDDVVGDVQAIIEQHPATLPTVVTENNNGVDELFTATAAESQGDSFEAYLTSLGIDAARASADEIDGYYDEYDKLIDQRNEFTDLYKLFETITVLTGLLDNSMDSPSGVNKQTLEEFNELVSDLGAFYKGNKNKYKDYEKSIASAIEQMKDLGLDGTLNPGIAAQVQAIIDKYEG